MVAPAHPNRTLRHPNDPAPASGSSEEYPIAPDVISEEADVEKRALAVARLEAAEKAVAEQLRPPPRIRVTPRFIALLAAAATVALYLGWSLPPGYLAAIVGSTALAWIVIAWQFRLQSAYVEWAWWAMLATYLFAVVRAAFFDC